MNVIFYKLNIHNFMSIGDIELNLQDCGYTLIQGINNSTTDFAKSNGSGKSSIWEALVWCLTGNTMRGSRNIENINLSGGTLVELNFSIDGNEFTVIRCKNHETYKTNLFVYLNGENISGKGIRDTENILKQNVGDLTSQVISSVIVLGQGLPSRFTNNSPSGRKEVLEELSKSDYMIEDLKDRIQLRKNNLTETITDIQNKNIELKSSISTLLNQIESDKQKLSSIESKDVYEKKLEQLNQNLTSSQKMLDKSESEYNSICEQLNSYKQIEYEKRSEYQEKERTIKDSIQPRMNEVLVSLDTTNIEINKINKEIESVKNIKDVCPTCGQKLPNVFKPDISDKEQERENLKNTLQKLQKLKTDLDCELVKNLTIIEQEYKDCIDKLKNSYLQLESSKKEYEKTIIELRNNINILKNTIHQLSLQINSIESIINSLNENIIKNENLVKELHDKKTNEEHKYEEWNQHLEIIKKFETIIKRDFRGYLLNNVINCINSKVKEYCLDVFDNTQLHFVQEGNNISISYCGKEYEMLSGGERQKIDLIVQFAIRDMLCQYLNFSCNILVLDEIFDNLDAIGCDKVIELISNKLSNISSVYIISHHAEELNIPTDNYLTIIKNSQGITSLKQ